MGELSAAHSTEYSDVCPEKAALNGPFSTPAALSHTAKAWNAKLSSDSVPKPVVPYHPTQQSSRVRPKGEVEGLPKPSLEKKVGVSWRFQERHESRRAVSAALETMTSPFGFFVWSNLCITSRMSRCLSLQVCRRAAHSATGNRGRHLCQGVKECFK